MAMGMLASRGDVGSFSRSGSTRINNQFRPQGAATGKVALGAMKSILSGGVAPTPLHGNGYRKRRAVGGHERLFLTI